jgi:hypothetical protein
MAKRLAYIILVAIAFFTAAAFMRYYPKTDSIFYGDAQGYYMYLPAMFQYHNLDSMPYLPTDRDIPSSVMWYAEGMRGQAPTPKGYILNQYTYGVALMELPFYAAGHLYAGITNQNQNGYSPPYENAIRWSSIVYCVLGMLVTFAILRRSFSATASLLMLVCIFIGTNLFWFTVYQSGMAHLPLFLLYALLTWLAIKLHESYKTIYFVLTGLVAGIITLIRPTDVICLIIPFLYGVYSLPTLKQRLHTLTQHRGKILLAAIVFILPILPQFAYWKWMTGNFLYYSYGDQGFNWRNPRILDGLFSFHNGWLAYSPIMYGAVIGLLLYKKIKNWAWCLWLLFPLYCYIIYSWYCYNYINGLGSRPMIHLYPLLAIPFCAFISLLATRPVWWRLAVATVAIFFISLNISFSVQRAKGMLISEEANMAFIAQTLYKSHLAYNDLVVMDTGDPQPNISKLEKLATLQCEHYEDSVSSMFIPDTTHLSGKYGYHIAHGEEHHPYTIKVKYTKETFGDAQWFKSSGRFMIPAYPFGSQPLLVLSVKRGETYKEWKAIKIPNKVGIADSSCGHDISMYHTDLNRWGYIYFLTRIPSDIEDGDLVELDVWNIGKEDIYLDDICLELYK